MADVRSRLDPVDYHLINETPDPDFSPERNKAIILETMAETDKYQKMLHSLRDKALEEKIDIIASYGDYRLHRSKTKSLENYLGKETYNKIIGEHLLDKLRVAQATNVLNKNKRSNILI